MTVSQAFVADETEGDQRTDAIAKLALVSGAGFIIGPAIGGVLSQQSLSHPFYASSLLFVGLLVGGALVLREPSRHALRSKQSLSSAQLLGQARDIARQQKLRAPVFVLLASAWAQLMTHSVMMLYVLNKFEFDSRQMGLLMSFSGVSGVVAQALVKPSVTLMSRPHTTALALACASLGCLVRASSMSVAIFVSGTGLMTFGYSVMRTTVMARITEVAPEDARGTYLGSIGAFESLLRVLSPTIGGLLMQLWEPLPLYIAALLWGLLAVFWYFFGDEVPSKTEKIE